MLRTAVGLSLWKQESQSMISRKKKKKIKRKKNKSWILTRTWLVLRVHSSWGSHFPFVFIKEPIRFRESQHVIICTAPEVWGYFLFMIDATLFELQFVVLLLHKNMVHWLKFTLAATPPKVYDSAKPPRRRVFWEKHEFVFCGVLI